MSGQSRSTSRRQIEALLLEAKLGSDSALGEALQKCRSDLIRAAQRAIERRPDCRGDHSDLVQEAFLNATRGFGRFQGASYPEFMGWLHRILLNKAAELARKRESRGPTGQNRKIGGASGISGLPDRGRSPSSVARHNEYRDLVQEALAKLPASYQQVLRMRFDEGLSFPDIGERLSLSEDAARMRFNRAMACFGQIIPRDAWHTDLSND
jgi:RNA polymerase sigma-70 factor, ECF subfamily